MDYREAPQCVEQLEDPEVEAERIGLAWESFDERPRAEEVPT